MKEKLEPMLHLASSLDSSLHFLFPQVSYVSCKPVYVVLSDVVSEHAFLLMVKYDANALQEGTTSQAISRFLVPEW